MLPMITMALVEEPDMQAFEKLYRTYRQKAYYAAFDVLNNEALAEECVSEAFLAVAKNFQIVNKLEPNKQLRYIVICSRNYAVNMLKKEKPNTVSKQYDDEEYFADDSCFEYDMLYWKESLNKLNKTDKDILYLRCILQLDYKTISKTLNISYEAARARVFAARNNLKKIMEKEDL